tara:strand:- start:220 stop:429 length:210 start_codon:yes stop_codon:yes gene_type:complete
MKINHKFLGRPKKVEPSSAPKVLLDGEPYPLDFWNYNVNPIVGYYVPSRLHYDSEKIKTKKIKDKNKIT